MVVSIEVKYLIEGEIYSDSFVKLSLEVKERNLELVDDFEYLFRMMTTVEMFLAERFKQA